MQPEQHTDHSASLEISVRTLAEHVYKKGNLSSGSFTGISGAEGTRLHTRVFSDLKKQYLPEFVDTEHRFYKEYQNENTLLCIRGRADCILRNADADVTVLEIKSCTGETLQLDTLVQEAHWAQVKLYACLFLFESPDILGVTAGLRYVSIESMDYVEKKEWIDRDEANIYFIHTCESYIHFARDLIAYRNKRNESIISMPFPYPTVRNGQKDFMKQVVQTISQKSLLLASAPTGTGKTMSTLYPAVKALGNQKCERIFYLTAKAAARVVAQKALGDMRKKGLFMRSITLQAKESLCLHPHLYCEAKICPCAVGYYDRLSMGISALLPLQEISPQSVTETAEKFSLCPHELALDISLFCDVIIGDYNHALHPRVRLDRYFGQKDTRYVLLMDEAHNLVDRSRDMFSASLSLSTLESCQKSIRGMDSRIDGYLMDLQNYFRIISGSIQRGEPAFPLAEKDVSEKAVMAAESFRAIRDIPRVLYKVLWKFCFFVRPVLDLLPVGEIKKNILEFFFDARFFLTILELYFDDTYVYTAQVAKGHSPGNEDSEMTLTLLCLDASSRIKNLIWDQHAAVFFSATLSPLHYYQTMLLGGNAEEKADTIELPSPFPPENLSLYIVDDIKTTYQERFLSLERVCGFILSSIAKKPGNYLVYLPSFLYLHRLFESLSTALQQDVSLLKKVELLRQEENMSRKMKENYLERFEIYGEKTLLAFAVLGGHFGEGIDLVGEKLKGVFVVGVGLPQIGPQREIMRQYYQEKFGDGFSFAYRFPGWEKVFQAAGRVIRDDEDTGSVVLIDERYKKPEYRALYPEHWNPLFIHHEDTPD